MAELEHYSKIQEIKQQIADLKSRFPAHSLKPEMVERLEALEEQLELLEREE